MRLNHPLCLAFVICQYASFPLPLRLCILLGNIDFLFFFSGSLFVLVSLPRPILHSQKLHNRFKPMAPPTAPPNSCNLGKCFTPNELLSVSEKILPNAYNGNKHFHNEHDETSSEETNNFKVFKSYPLWTLAMLVWWMSTFSFLQVAGQFMVRIFSFCRKNMAG